MNCPKCKLISRNFNLLTHDPVKYSNLRLFSTSVPRVSTYPLISFKISYIFNGYQKNDFLSRNYLFYSTGLTKVPEQTSPLEPELNKSELEKYEWAQDFLFDIDSVPIDREYALAYSNRILDDPISFLSVEESSKFKIPVPNSDLSKVYDFITRPFRIYYLQPSAVTMLYSIIERVENEELNKAFDVGEGFNKRMYFITLHFWLITRRTLKEIPEGFLLYPHFSNVFDDLIRIWIYRRDTPEVEFNKQFRYTRSHMMKFVYELNKCTMDSDLYPYRLSVTIKRIMYEDSVSDETLDLLVKYLIRQFLHLSNLDRDCFLHANFLWADAEEICKPARLLKRPIYQLTKHLGYRGIKHDNRVRTVGPNGECLEKTPMARLGVYIRSLLARPSGPQISKVEKLI